MPTIFINNGNLLIGQILATFGAGICTAQAWDYYTTFTDAVWMQVYVGVMMVCFLYSTVASQSYSLYFTLINNAGNESPHYPPVYFTSLFINSIVLLMGQLFFIRRGYMVWKQPIVWSVLVLSALAAMGTGMRAGYLAIVANDATSIPQAIAAIEEMINFINIETGLLVATDVLIAGLLVYKLLETRREVAGFNKTTDTLLNTLMKIAVGTSSISAALSIFILVCLKAQPLGVTYHLILSSSQGAIAVTCVLYALNSRERLRAMTGTSHNNIKDMNTMSNGEHRAGRGLFSGNPTTGAGTEVQGISIHLETFVREEQGNPRDNIDEKV